MLEGGEVLLDGEEGVVLERVGRLIEGFFLFLGR